MNPQAWADRFDLPRLSRILRGIPKASRKSGPEHNLSGKERQLLNELLLAGADGAGLSSAKLCDLVGVKHGNGSLLLRRLGRAGLVVNLSARKGTLKLALEANPLQWDLSRLKAIRRSDSSRVRSIRGPDSSRAEPVPRIMRQEPANGITHNSQGPHVESLPKKEGTDLIRDTTVGGVVLSRFRTGQNPHGGAVHAAPSSPLASLVPRMGPPPPKGGGLWRIPHG